MALMKVRGNLERLFDKNLNDLVRGIRNHKVDEGGYIAQCLEEIKQELRHPQLSVKTNAVAKLTYLQMLGYDISWAGFNVIEVMSSPKFTEKRIGYLAAAQSFSPATDVLMLTTNMIRKDLNASHMYEAGVALSSLACFISPDLARDLANDILSLLSSTKPYLRKKAVLILYKVFLRYPDALRPAFPRLREKLDDPDPGVQSAAVNVICELARKNPKNYLSLAPTFFKLMTTSTNNWMLIKIIKLFGALTPLEPRLGQKLIEPLTNLIHSTSAMSLLYECINTVIAVLISISSGMPNHTAAIQLCVQKLRILIEDSDQNLKYLGLMAMSKILKTHPKSVQGHKDLIMRCLDDSDESIRLRALDLLYGMVSKKNLMEIVKKLMLHMDQAEGTHYRDELMEKIVQICSQDDYQYITHFEWYVSVLVELTQMEGTSHGPLLASQMMDVAIRVESVRTFAVQQMAILVENYHLLVGAGKRNSVSQVLYAAAWVCGEFPRDLNSPTHTLESMMGSRIGSLPGHIQSVYIHNGLKLWCYIINRAREDGTPLGAPLALGRQFVDHLEELITSSDLEVQERASSVMQVVKIILEDSEDIEPGLTAADIEVIFSGDLNPVAPKAQRKVPLPEGLDLDAWINEPLPSSESESESDLTEPDLEVFVKAVNAKKKSKKSRKAKEKSEDMDPEEIKRLKELRLLEQSSNPNYLKGGLEVKSRNESANALDEIPIQPIDLGIPLHIPGLASSDQYFNISQSASELGEERKKKKKKKKSKNQDDDGTAQDEKNSSGDDANKAAFVPVVIKKALDMPEGMNMSEDEEDQLAADDPHRALGNITLDDLEVIQKYEPQDVYGHNAMQHEDIPKSLFGSDSRAKKSSKAKDPEESKRDKKGKKKKKKHNKETRSSAERDDEADEDPAQKKKKKKKKDKSTERVEPIVAETPGADDIDFWMK
eukprot:snap_masked-scaffold43_size480169-processed-gene-2.9 protein:Tk12727 transcript:snap_masked-scaffold43_size480169-processed-gene-2.9-mRNA-1 annotation:"ap-3 complex subunit delta-1-like isoform x3"